MRNITIERKRRPGWSARLAGRTRCDAPIVGDRKDVLTLIAREPSVGIKLIEVLCQRLRSMSNQIEQSLTSKLDARIAARLLNLAEDYGHNIAIAQERLARSVSATRESVNRQLRIWENAGIIEIRRGCIVLKDAEALKPP